MERLKGKTAIVVGAGSIGPGWGNGKATAVTFAREGAQVFCVDRNGKAAQETVDIITGEGGKATAFTADVSRAAEVEAMVAACLKTYGRIDVLDNNVGIAEMGSVVDVSEADWDRVFAVNLKSAFLAMKHVIPVMVRQGGGSIINISSIASIRHIGVSYVTYATTKAAMNQMTRTTAVEFAAKHVRVNAILPGLMKTPMVEHSAGLAASYASGRCRGDVARPRRAGADGTHGRSLGRRQRRAVSGVRRIEIRHRHRAGGRWRDHAEDELGLLRRPRESGDPYAAASTLRTLFDGFAQLRTLVVTGPAFAGTTVHRRSLRYCASARIPPASECQAGVTLIGQFSSLTATSAAPP